MNLSQFDALSRHTHTLLEYDWLFIGGAEKSGTTWLQRLLDAHPEIHCKGEGHFFDTLYRGLSALQKHYTDTITRTGNDVYEGRPYYTGMEAATQDMLFQMAVASTITPESLTPQIRYIGDKTPANVRYFADAMQLFPGAKCIHIVRDPRDVTVSLIRHMQRHFDPEEWTFDAKTEVAAKHWQASVTAALTFRESYPESYIQVRYKDLKNHALETVTSLFDFLGVSTDESMVRHCIERTDFSRMSGGRAPGQEDNSSFLRKGIVWDWKNHLQPHHLEIIERYCGEYMTQFGYASETV